jgi:hypothetical protein
MDSKRKTLALLLVLLFLASPVLLPINTVKAQSSTLIVPDQYPTIQEAINNASAGDTILVRAGSYNTTVAYADPLQEGSLFINKTISLIGENSQNTIINTQEQITWASALLIVASGVTISGFTINGNGNIIQIYSDSANITGNIINTSGDSIAIDTGDSDSQIISNIVKGNFQGIGISFSGGSCLVSNNLVSGFKSGIGGNCKNIQIINNTITNNAFGYQPLNYGTFSYNNILNNYQYNVFPSVAGMDATYNWWGTIDPEAINQTIAHNDLSNYPLGNVNFIPYLNESNTQATPQIGNSIVIPTLPPLVQSTNAPTPTSSVPELSWLVILPLLLSLFSVAVLVRYRKTAN